MSTSSTTESASVSTGKSGSISGTESATQRVFTELRTRIIQGAIAPGQRLKIETLKQQLDTGTTPIREALSLLTSDHLVERIDQRGFRAASASKDNFEEILALRCQLEDIALRKSINSGDTAWEEQLVLHHHRLSQTDRNDTSNFESLHKAFHIALLNACDSPILLKFCDQLYDLNIRYRYLAGKSLGYSKRDVSEEHKAILDATLARDADSATERLIHHYTLTGEFLSDQLGVTLNTPSS